MRALYAMFKRRDFEPGDTRYTWIDTPDGETIFRLERFEPDQTWNPIHRYAGPLDAKRFERAYNDQIVFWALEPLAERLSAADERREALAWLERIRFRPAELTALMEEAWVWCIRENRPNAFFREALDVYERAHGSITVSIRPQNCGRLTD